MSTVVYAAGFTLGSWGALGPSGPPYEPIASFQNALPLPLGDIVKERRLAVHSVRRGFHGEPEVVVRAFFAARRGTGIGREPHRTRG